MERDCASGKEVRGGRGGSAAPRKVWGEKIVKVIRPFIQIQYLAFLQPPSSSTVALMAPIVRFPGPNKQFAALDLSSRLSHGSVSTESCPCISLVWKKSGVVHPKGVFADPLSL